MKGMVSNMENSVNEQIYNKPWILQRADPYVYRHMT